MRRGAPDTLVRITLAGLMLGVTTTVAVAWAASVWADGRLETAEFGGADVREWPVPVPEGWSAPVVTSVQRHRFLTVYLVNGSRPAPEGLPIACVVMRHQAGWPARALESIRVVEMQHKSVYKQEFDPGLTGRGIGGVGARDPMAGRTGVLPLRPVIGGFAADVALYGGAWTMLFLGVRGGRRMLRRRGDRCVECGYLLAGLTDCPECGPGAGREEDSPA